MNSCGISMKKLKTLYYLECLLCNHWVFIVFLFRFCNWGLLCYNALVSPRYSCCARLPPATSASESVTMKCSKNKLVASGLKSMRRKLMGPIEMNNDYTGLWKACGVWLVESWYQDKFVSLEKHVANNCATNAGNDAHTIEIRNCR